MHWFKPGVWLETRKWGKVWGHELWLTPVRTAKCKHFGLILADRKSLSGGKEQKIALIKVQLGGSSFPLVPEEMLMSFKSTSHAEISLGAGSDSTWTLTWAAGEKNKRLSPQLDLSKCKGPIPAWMHFSCSLFRILTTCRCCLLAPWTCRCLLEICVGKLATKTSKWSSTWDACDRVLPLFPRWEAQTLSC